MFEAYCHLEGDVDFGKAPKTAISIMRGRESLIRKIIKEFCVIGVFSGEEKPMIEAVNQASKTEQVNQDLSCLALAEWLQTVEAKYPDNGVFFTQVK